MVLTVTGFSRTNLSRYRPSDTSRLREIRKRVNFGFLACRGRRTTLPLSPPSHLVTRLAPKWVASTFPTYRGVDARSRQQDKQPPDGKGVGLQFAWLDKMFMRSSTRRTTTIQRSGSMHSKTRDLLARGWQLEGNLWLANCYFAHDSLGFPSCYLAMDLGCRHGESPQSVIDTTVAAI
jgi:hypothetical protein